MVDVALFDLYSASLRQRVMWGESKGLQRGLDITNAWFHFGTEH
jgi:hypothetical protein